MHDPRPALALLLCQGLALLALLGYWLGLPLPRRQTHLLRLWAVEQVPLPPPTDLVAQARWLVTHRLQRLRGMALLGGVACLLGAVEGSERRRHHPFGGFGFARLALGQLLGTLALGAMVAAVVVPWPLPLVPTAAVLASLVGLTAYLLAAGKPLMH
jgi:hypothetical protein